MKKSYRMIGSFLLSIALALGATGAKAAGAGKEAFDRDRYIDIDEIEVGMRGYGRTVFQGTKPERFEVEVVSVLRNSTFTGSSGAKRSLIMIKCRDERFELPKGIQGVSGSPVYIKDRMAGAMSYGINNGEEPMYGVTPIREMLEVRNTGDLERPKAQRANFYFEPELYQDLMREVLLSPEQLGRLARASGLWTERSEVAGGLVRLSPAITIGGVSEPALKEIRQWLPWLQGSPVMSSVHTASEWTGKIKLEPGGTLTIPQIMGDINMGVLGTVTEVSGNRVYGFGHPWNAEGMAQWPMATGYVHTLVSRKPMSFKLGQPVEVVGAIRADEAAGVYGQIGAKAPMIPVSMRVHWDYLQAQEDFSMRLAQDRQIDASLAMTAALSGLLYRGGFPREHTIRYQLHLSFEGMKGLHYDRISTQSDILDLVSDLYSPLGLILRNPWEEVKLTGMKMEATIEDKASIAEIARAQINQRIFRPGERMVVRAELLPLRDTRRMTEIALDLPEDIPPGKYKAVLGSDLGYQGLIREAQPHRYVAYDTEDIQEILQERLSIPRNGLFLGLILPRKGLAIERHELPDLPGSRTLLLSDKSRKLTLTPFRTLVYHQIKSDYVLAGKQIFDIEVRRD